MVATLARQNLPPAPGERVRLGFSERDAVVLPADA